MSDEWAAVIVTLGGGGGSPPSSPPPPKVTGVRPGNAVAGSAVPSSSAPRGRCAEGGRRRALPRARLAALAGVVLLALGGTPVTARAAPLTWLPPFAVTSAGGMVDLLGVACPSAAECVAVDSAGEEVTFDPSMPGMTAPVMIDPGIGLRAIACPSSIQCTAIDGYGRELTFDPSSPSAPTPTPIDATRSPSALACPSASECVAVDGKGAEITFDPGAPGAPTPVVLDPAGNPLFSVTCPSTSECVAVESATPSGSALPGRDGAEVTFDPVDPGSPSPVIVDRVGELLLTVACPSASLCAAFDIGGFVVTFNPNASNISTVAPVSGGGTPLAASCLSTSQCIAVDAGGHAFLGDPGDPSSWTVVPIATPNALNAIDCRSPGLCVAVDNQADAVVGVSAPMDETPPAISGFAVAGQTLNAGHGSWSPDPTRYTYQWQRCGASGDGCAAISGAKGGTFGLTAADVGSTIRVQVTASDAAGAGPQAVSAATAVVTAAEPGGGAARPRITGFRVTNDRFLVGLVSTPLTATATAHPDGRTVGTVFEYSLSEAASVRLAISQRLAGRRRGRRCVAPAAKLRRASACTRHVSRGALIRASRRGANQVPFSGRIAGRALAPARYDARLTAIDAAKRASNPVSLSFTVVAR